MGTYLLLEKKKRVTSSFSVPSGQYGHRNYNLTNYKAVRKQQYTNVKGLLSKALNAPISPCEGVYQYSICTTEALARTLTN